MRKPSRNGVRAMVALALFGAGLLPVGCAAPDRNGTRPLHDAERLERSHRPAALADPRRLAIFEASTGSALDWDEMMGMLVAADVVLIGEMHGHAQGGAVETALFSDILASAPRAPAAGPSDVPPADAPPADWREGAGAPALSLEFFARDQQTSIDDYLTGVADEKTFRERTRRTESSYPEAHRAMLEAAKEAGRPVIAANAPRRYVALAREEGLERLRGLTEAQRALFEIPDALTQGPYRDRFFDDMALMMAEHMPEVEHKDPGEGDDSIAEAQQRNLDRAAYAMIEQLYLSQNVWDATMAASVADALIRGLRPVVHVVGQFHVDRDGGLLQRLRAARPNARIVTLSLVGADAPSGGGIDEDDLGRADVVVYIGAPD